MHHLFSNIKQHQKIIFQIAFGLLFVALGIYFIKHEVTELSSVRKTLANASPIWVLSGLVFLGAFVIIQGLMYKTSFEAIHEQIRLSTGISLFLKRNLVSVFLPAGVLTNMLFFNESVEKKEGVSSTQTYFASSIFSICSILSGIVVGLPALIWLLLKQSLSGKMAIGIVISSIAVVAVVAAVISIVRKGWLFDFLEKKVPSFAMVLNEMTQQAFSYKKFWQVAGLSFIIEIIGITHLYIAAMALGAKPGLEMVIIGYAIVLLLLMSSPFLRGIGAVEVALTYALTLFGLSSVMAISIAFLFRFFEFWLVLVLGVVTLVARRDNILIRMLPALLLFILGIVNILSGVSPAMEGRMSTLTDILPLEAIHASTWLVILAGIIMLATSIFLLKGLRNAWIVAIVLSSLSLIAHLSKGIDWEESSVALITLGSLIYQRKTYFIRPNIKLERRSILPGIVAAAAVIIFGTVAFYFLDPSHFNVNFTLKQSFFESVTTFLMLNIDLTPATTFARDFLNVMNILGGIAITYFVFLVFRHLVHRPDTGDIEEQEHARALVKKHGCGSLDYFKTYYDKKYWIEEDLDSFISFKTSRNYAIALENPVCANESQMVKCIKGFDDYCRQNGLRPAYYRIPETSKSIYESLGKKVLPIGEEAVVNLLNWTTSGTDKKDLRNVLNRLTKTGYEFHINEPPQKDAFLQQLKAVSDQWLKDLERSELVFSQGLFDESELKEQTILSVENIEGKVVGFCNLIPDYAYGEANFDLMRKTKDAPNGVMAFLFDKMFEYLRENGYKSCNLGMVPMSGINDPENIQERGIKVAYERIRRFGHYKSLRAFKEKFNPDWNMMYLVYDEPFDLIYLPLALETVIEP